MKREMPTGLGSAHYDGSHSTYPDVIRIIMSDGNTLEYRKSITQPRPHLASLLSYDFPRKHEKK